MYQDEYSTPENSASRKQEKEYERYLNPMDILVPQGYNVEVYAHGFDAPISMIFTDQGELLIGESGVIGGEGRVLRLNGDHFEVIADGFNVPLTGINYLNGDIYVSHRGKITVIQSDGSKVDILSGLPSFGDHHNNKVEFGSDGKMYFGQGTATNSGVVGLDNDWVEAYPYFHDYAGTNSVLTGLNFVTENMLSEAREPAYTGAFSPFGVLTPQGNNLVRGYTKASGSILRANLDGSDLEQVAWGFRNPFRLKFDADGNLYAANHGSDVRGSRPIANSPDEFQLVIPGLWYGWPDFTGGRPVILPEFKPEGKPQPQFLLRSHSTVPKPFAIFEPHSAIMGFDINYNPDFGPYGNVFIAEYGSEAPETTGGVPLPGVGHRVSQIDMSNGKVYPFAINRSGIAASESGEGGFDRPIDVVFGPDGAMYVLDFAVTKAGEPDEFYPGTGVIWRITKS